MRITERICSIIENCSPSRNLWFWLFMMSLMSVYDIMSFHLSEEFSFLIITGEICFAMLKSTILTYLYAICRPHRWLRATMMIIVVLYSALSCVNFISYFLYNRGISRTFFIILYETDRREAGEFAGGLADNLISTLTGTRFISSIVIGAAVYLLFRLLPAKILKYTCLLISAAGLLFSIHIIFFMSWGRTSHLMLLRTPQFAYAGWLDHKSMREAERFMRPLPHPRTATTKALAQDVIVVIGESSARLHNSLYGYPIATNRYTSQLRDSLFIFTDAIGSSCATADNMPRILTFMPDTVLGNWYEYPSVFQLFKKLGYKTFWLSNQEKSGSVSNSSTSIASAADIKKYAGAVSSDDHLSINHDDVLLPLLRKALTVKTDRRLIFLHLLGSHVKYSERFPPQFSKITPEDEMRLRPRKWLDTEKARICADYDNSVLFTDSLLYEMIGTIKGSPRPSLLIYFSDHGEHIYDYSDHCGRNKTTATIPCWIYLNQSYRKANPDITGRLSEVTGLRFTTANTIHLLITLTGSEYALYNPRLDIMDKRYESTRIRYVDESPWPLDR